MQHHLKRLQELRGLDARIARDPRHATRTLAVKRWQRARLAATYADLSASHRYGKATAFFLDRLYGDVDAVWRDRDLLRMYPTMKRLLPSFAFETVTNALALDVLAEEFDQAMADALGASDIAPAAYAAAFRRVGRREDRLRQVALMRGVGEGLDAVVRKPLIFSTLKMLRRPSKLAGLAEMQHFLEEGFTAFRHMSGASHFLDTIAARETALIEALFAGRDDALPVVAT